MALGFAIALAVLVLLYKSPRVNDDGDLATQSQLHEYKEWMNKNMEQLQKDQEIWSGDQEKVWAPRRLREDQSWRPPQNKGIFLDAASRHPEANPEVNEGTWGGGPYVVLVILFLFGCCRHSIVTHPAYDSSSDESSTASYEDLDDDTDDTDLEPEHNLTRQKILEDFYDRHVEADTSDLSDMCSFIETFVNDLLNSCRDDVPEQNLLLENCIGVGSAFEGWHIQKGSKPFQVLVPIAAPKGHAFQPELSEEEHTPSKHGHILVEMECLCKRERLLGDVVCPVHHASSQQNHSEGPTINDLRTRSHLDVDKTVHWFQDLVEKGWEKISHKYNLDLVPRPSNTSCRLKLLFKSGRTVSIDLILGVKVGDSLVFLATQGDEKDRLSGTVWQRNLSVLEFIFFDWVSQRLPEDSCHLRCLQIVIFMKECSPTGRKKPVLSDYHYKTCLMHLLLAEPRLDWDPDQIAQRVEDLLLCMNTALKEKYLPHFVIGNICLPIRIPIPQALRSANPPNLFQHLEQDRGLHAKAMKEFVEVIERLRALCAQQYE